MGERLDAPRGAPCSTVALTPRFFISVMHAGGQLGTVLGNAASGLLLHHFEWPVTFYFFGVLGVLWCVLASC